ncbi:unnamed protein product [Sphenostylis stenocarpa]|uniref:Carbohydrate kinase PfkB domain-containing protein n=1 Tax=Sphenostylis stenocarpa TaxID=92480 RepID=A0AA87B9B7_9FABA|nr:unnamed protein product [Sphenostylis stenocarpa]
MEIQMKRTNQQTWFSLSLLLRVFLCIPSTYPSASASRPPLLFAASRIEAIGYQEFRSRVEGVKVKAIDTTGAGDAFV